MKQVGDYLPADSNTIFIIWDCADNMQLWTSRAEQWNLAQVMNFFWLLLFKSQFEIKRRA